MGRITETQFTIVTMETIAPVVRARGCRSSHVWVWTFLQKSVFR